MHGSRELRDHHQILASDREYRIEPLRQRRCALSRDQWHNQTRVQLGKQV